MPRIDISPLGDAVRQLEQGLLEAERQPSNELLRDGVIQRFEYTHELAIKFIRRVLETVFGDDVDRTAYNDLLRTAAERGLIESAETWFAYRAARNKTSHTYDATVAAEVYTAARLFLADAQYFLTHLHDVTDKPQA